MGSNGATFQTRYSSDVIERNAMASGVDGTRVATQLAEQLAAPGLRLAVAYADARVDLATFARELQRRLDAPVVGCSANAVIGVAAADAGEPISVALGLYGDWLRAGVGVATELAKSPIARSRDAIRRAAAALGTHAEALDPVEHVAFTLVDGSSGHDDAFCIGSAAAAPQIKVVGGVAPLDRTGERRPQVFANGEALADAGVAVVLETRRRFEAFSSQHVVPTELKAVVTATGHHRGPGESATAGGRGVITELDGRPAVPRLRELLESIGIDLHAPRPTSYTFARYVDGIPYVRVIRAIDGDSIQLAASVEPGHVMRVMRTGDLVGTTRADLAAVAARIGGISALLAWSCMARHWEAEASGLARELAEVYASYPICGYRSLGEQAGMLLVNYTLAGLAIGELR